MIDMAPMNILMISPFDLVVERMWGPTLRLFCFGKEMVKKGHNVILAGPTPAIGDKPNEIDGVKLYYLYTGFFHQYGYPPEVWDKIPVKRNTTLSFLKLVIKRFLEIKKIIKNEKIDLIYMNRALPYVCFSVFLAKHFRKTPLIYDWDDIEGLFGFSSSWKLPLKSQLITTALEVIYPRISNVTVVASHFIYDFAKSIGITEDRLFYAPSVVDTDEFNPAISGSSIRKKYGINNEPLILYVGNLESGSGVMLDNLIKTMRLIVKEIPDAKMLIVGDGDTIKIGNDHGLLRVLAKRYNIVDNIIFTGNRSHQEIPYFIAASDVCIALFPVNVITMAKSPVKIYEYMACGKPIVARAVGEVNNIFQDGKSGILTYSDDVKEYADKICNILTDKKLAEKIGKNARKAVEEKYNWKESSRVVTKACERALDKDTNVSTKSILRNVIKG